MIEVEKYGKEDGEWDSNKNISNADVPKTDEPSSISGWEERFACRQCT